MYLVSLGTNFFLSNRQLASSPYPFPALIQHQCPWITGIHTQGIRLVGLDHGHFCIVISFGCQHHDGRHDLHVMLLHVCLLRLLLSHIHQIGMYVALNCSRTLVSALRRGAGIHTKEHISKLYQEAKGSQKLVEERDAKGKIEGLPRTRTS